LILAQFPSTIYSYGGSEHVEIIATVDKDQHFKSFISQMASIRLEYSSRHAENSLVNNFQSADHFF